PPGGETGADRRRFCHRWPPLAAGSYTSCAGRITSLGSRLCCRPFLSVLVTLRNTALLSPLPHAHSADSYDRSPLSQELPIVALPIDRPQQFLALILGDFGQSLGVGDT